MARPRIDGPGITATQRVAASTAALVAAGGVRETFRLSPDAYEALKILTRLPDAPGTETGLIDSLLLSEKERFMKSATNIDINHKNTDT